MNKIQQMYDSLLKESGPQGWWPIINEKTLLCEYHTNAPRNESEALEICFGSLLTQGTNWHPNAVRALQQMKLGRLFTEKELAIIREAESGNESTPQRKVANHREKSLIGVHEILRISHEHLSGIIRSSGYHNQKAIKLKNFCRFLEENYGGSLSALFREDESDLKRLLLSVKGIGPETADSIMLYAARKPIFVIDAYTKRIAGRIGFREKNYEGLQRRFMPEIFTGAANSEKLFNEYHALLVELGKNACRKVPLCGKCPLSGMCAYYKGIGKEQL